jgi:phosphoribosyl 1,2-cyclic phosphodiesterase
VKVWGSRGSIASPAADTIRYGGNTACVQVAVDDGTTVILDAGTGLRRLGQALAVEHGPVHILLSHLHLDHIQGLGFFRPFFQTGSQIHIWGPASTTADLSTRLSRYLSPPLFPVRLKDLPSRLEFHDVGGAPWPIGNLDVRAASVIHPDPTVGYRISDSRGALAYLPDHELALGGSDDPRWTSGFDLAAGVDLLIHDAQYTDEEYAARVGWGHSSIVQTVAFANRVGAAHLVLFHHDPEHDDAWLDRLLAEAQLISGDTRVSAAREGITLDVGTGSYDSRAQNTTGPASEGR